MRRWFPAGVLVVLAAAPGLGCTEGPNSGTTAEDCVGLWYADLDGDGYGADVVECDAPGAVEASGDCDDADPSVHPDAEEACDGRDDNCDGVGDAATQLWYADEDGDGVGAGESVTSDCVQPERTASQSGDCDDSDADAYPGAPEYCDERDTNCDGVTDEQGTASWHTAGGWEDRTAALTWDGVSPVATQFHEDGELLLCGGTWHFNLGVYGPPLTAVRGNPSFERPIIDASGGRAIVLASGAMELEYVAITGGQRLGQYDEGAGIAADDNTQLTLSDVEMYGNQASWGGAAIALGDGGSLVADRIDVHDNIGGYGPGGILAAEPAMLVITNSTFTDNTTTAGNGGALYSGVMTVSDCIFSGNSASVSGGAIGAGSEGLVSITSSTFTGNHAGGDGGAVSSGGSWSATALSDDTFSGNSADGKGGAVFIATSEECGSLTFSDNTAGEDGGGLYYHGNPPISGLTFDGNQAGGSGGGAFIAAGTGFSISEVSATDNSAVAGGALAFSGVVNATGLTLTGNSASDGGAIRLEERESAYSLALGESTLSWNTATNDGGAISFAGEFRHLTLTMDRVDISDNTAARNGGAVAAIATALEITDSTLSFNSAGASGGGVYASIGDSIESVLLSGDVIEGNTAGDGAGVAVIESPLDISDGTWIVGNVASGHGGGVYVTESGSPATCESSTVTGNAALDGWVYTGVPRDVLDVTSCDWGTIESNAGVQDMSGTTTFSCGQSGCEPG